MKNVNYQILIMCIGIIVLVVLFSAMIYTIYQIGRYFREKRSFTNVESISLVDSINSNANKTSMELVKKIETTDKLLDMIDMTVDIEIINMAKNLTTLNQRYDVKNMDKDISNISTKVYKSFKSDIYDSNEVILTAEYLMEYIISYTTSELIKLASELNGRINLESNSENI